MSIKKNLRRLMSEPTDMRIDEIINIFAYYGFKLIKIQGSHHQFLAKNGEKITIRIIRFFL